ncbi:acyl-CoA dehydrogenase family protein [Phenylobacterium sp.]|jgi:alkylation response protein AidB-like acyl-CoA dehydrogenase|uniref:acyl-CoA dehydrogenase family protein n=1 Tax=Phenylobacterium sp. TaxID=1871053 RepID=UPI0037CC1967
MQDLGRLGFSEDQSSLLDVASSFCASRSPMAKVRRLIEDETGHDPDVWREIVELGWLGIAIPEEYGGAGLGLAEVVPVMEQMGRYMLAGPFLSTTLAAQAILAGGTDDQKRVLLPRLAEGAITTLALCEANDDWDLGAIAATATRTPGGTLRLAGAKRLVCDAEVATHIIASVLVEGRPALVMFERAALAPGALRREVIIDETKRSYALTLDGLEVSEDSLMDPARAASALHHIHLTANLLAAAEMCGGTQSVIDYTVDYLKTRVQFGKLIGSYQALKHPIVDAYVGYEQARSHLYSAAHCFNEQGVGEIATRMAKAQADTAMSFAADRAIQFHGGFGFTYDCDAQLYRRRAIWHASQYGDAAYHKAKLADLLL